MPYSASVLTLVSVLQAFCYNVEETNCTQVKNHQSLMKVSSLVVVQPGVWLHFRVSSYFPWSSDSICRCQIAQSNWVCREGPQIYVNITYILLLHYVMHINVTSKFIKLQWFCMYSPVLILLHTQNYCLASCCVLDDECIVAYDSRQPLTSMYLLINMQTLKTCFTCVPYYSKHESSALKLHHHPVIALCNTNISMTKTMFIVMDYTIQVSFKTRPTVAHT